MDLLNYWNKLAYYWEPALFQCLSSIKAHLLGWSNCFETQGAWFVLLPFPPLLFSWYDIPIEHWWVKQLIQYGNLIGNSIDLGVLGGLIVTFTMNYIQRRPLPVIIAGSTRKIIIYRDFQPMWEIYPPYIIPLWRSKVHSTYSKRDWPVALWQMIGRGLLACSDPLSSSLNFSYCLENHLIFGEKNGWSLLF